MPDIGRLISILVAVALLLQGCSGRSRVQIDERSVGAAGSLASQTQSTSKVKKSHQKISPVPAVYRVKRGDTLYSIAWRYGLDYRQVAARNRIGKNYQIYPGQRLALKAPKVAAKPVKPVVARSVSRPVKKAVKNTVQPVVTPVPEVRAVNKPKESPAVAAKQKIVAQKTHTQEAEAVKKPVVKSRNVRWRWPADGRIIAGFRTKGQVNKGLNLAGKKGDPVLASAAGEVVYAGSGLLGYGNLIIINHNQKFLSAYAHNSRVFVKESDMVKGGQKIAEIGRSGTSREMLHFEIRRDGVPVNPLQYLPKR